VTTYCVNENPVDIDDPFAIQVYKSNHIPQRRKAKFKIADLRGNEKETGSAQRQRDQIYDGRGRPAV